jgi:hypothetical protein
LNNLQHFDPFVYAIKTGEQTFDLDDLYKIYSGAILIDFSKKTDNIEIIGNTYITKQLKDHFKHIPVSNVNIFDTLKAVQNLRQINVNVITSDTNILRGTSSKTAKITMNFQNYTNAGVVNIKLIGKNRVKKLYSLINNNKQEYTNKQ